MNEINEEEYNSNLKEELPDVEVFNWTNTKKSQFLKQAKIGFNFYFFDVKLLAKTFEFF